MEMISLLSKYIALFLFNNNIIDESSVSVCEYGMEIIISTLIGFLLILTSGIVFGEIGAAMLFYGLFVAVRLFSGGYHANSHLKCKLTMLCCCLLVLVTAKYLIDKFSLVHHLLFLAVYILTIFNFAPIENINIPLDDNLKKHKKRVSIIIAIILVTISGCAYWYTPKFAIVTSLTLFIIAILIIIPKFSRKENLLYEKDN